VALLADGLRKVKRSTLSGDKRCPSKLCAGGQLLHDEIDVGARDFATQIRIDDTWDRTIGQNRPKSFAIKTSPE
jgi:hypothetical protein